MALSRFVIGSTVTLPAGLASPTWTAGGFGTVSYAGTGSGATQQWADGSAATFIAGTAVYADSASPGSTPTGAQQLYTALTAAGANLFAFRDGTDAIGHAATSNLGGLMLQQPAVPATSSAGLTNFATNTTGNTAYVSVGANGATMANYWVSAVSVATSATAFMMTVPPGGTCALQYTVATPVWYWSECTIALPASTAPAANTTGRDLSVVFLGGGSVSAVTVNGLTTNIVQAPTMNSQGIPFPAGSVMAVTYTGTVCWTWLDPLDMPLPHSDAPVYAAANTVAATGVNGFSPLNTLPYAVHAATGAPGYGVGVSN